MALPNQQTVDYPSRKLVIVGDGRTGKTTFVKRSSMVSLTSHQILGQIFQKGQKIS
ncbi:hypothetical protein ACSBR2_027101 [Camellia fascicularis]